MNFVCSYTVSQGLQLKYCGIFYHPVIITLIGHLAYIS